MIAPAALAGFAVAASSETIKGSEMFIASVASMVRDRLILPSQLGFAEPG
jgi:hypothetical protein